MEILKISNGFPKALSSSKSLTAKYCTEAVFDKMAPLKTKNEQDFSMVINSAVQNLDSGIGCYAPTTDAYDVYSGFFDKVIEDYHGHKVDDKHQTDLKAENLKGDNVDPDGRFVVSTRIRVGRNLEGTGLAGGITQKERLDVEKQVTAALSTLEGELKGEYYPLQGMDEKTRQNLVDDHFLFKRGDRFLEAAGANRNWPEGRGIFHSANKQFLVWVNEEDQLRIISMQMGGNVKEVFARLTKAITTMEDKIKFARNDHLGYITSCPTNLGTAMRASVHVKIPFVSKQDNFKEFCAGKHLSVRGIHGEHSESAGGIYDISNKRRLGISELECVQNMYDGVAALIEWEKKLESEQPKKEEVKEEEVKEEEVKEEVPKEEAKTESKEEEAPKAEVVKTEETVESPQVEAQEEEQTEEQETKEEAPETEEAKEEKPAE